ncbi:MAG: hydroxymethylglutaryl-CoA lyase [Pseudomonadota bacterium]
MSGVTLVDVTPRDGLQSVGPFVATKHKLDLIARLVAAGYHTLEAGAFVSPKHVPQMRDAAEIASGVAALPGTFYFLTPNPKGAALALEQGVTHLAYVVSATEGHNQANTRRSIAASLDELETFWTALPAPKPTLKLAISCTFHCPFEGRVPSTAPIAIVERVLGFCDRLSIALCDTTGRAHPTHVQRLSAEMLSRFGDAHGPWVYHGHDTYGFGVANALAAWGEGVTLIEGCAGGLGGCPFAPGATGNTASEDLVFAFEEMGVTTGIDLEKLLEIADDVAAMDGVVTGGHIRQVPRARVLG